jgi:Cof subfamily protein (haloacid dehalogenase superfamily)
MAAFQLKCIALDLDGTTLKSNHTLSDKTIETLRRINGEGTRIIVATGRSWMSVEKYLLQLKLPQLTTPVISYNGGHGMLITVKEDGTVLREPKFQSFVKPEIIRSLIKLSEDMGTMVQYYNADLGDGVYCVPRNDEHRELMARYSALVGVTHTVLDSYEDAFKICPSVKILIMSKDPDAVIAEAHKRKLEEELLIIRGSPDPFMVEFLSIETSKGAMLKTMCDFLGIDMQEVVSFGDGENDVQMLELCGMGLAMKNARDAPKEAANAVIQV